MSKDTSGNEISLATDYAGNPAIRALMRLIPGGLGSAADVFIMEKAARIKQERAEAFFRELEEGKVRLTKDLLDNNEFLHSLDVALRAAARTRRAEKICMFARLLQRGFLESHATSTDDYEEMVSLLEDLSYREWQALLLFEGFLTATQPNDNPLARVQAFWNEFVILLESDIGVPKLEASSFMIRIGRTGLFQEITGAYWDYSGGMGILTPKFDRFRMLVAEKLRD